MLFYEFHEGLQSECRTPFSLVRGCARGAQEGACLCSLLWAVQGPYFMGVFRMRGSLASGHRWRTLGGIGMWGTLTTRIQFVVASGMLHVLQ